MTAVERACPAKAALPQIGQARRELKGELGIIRDLATTAGFFDESSQTLDRTSSLIQKWAINFLKALELTNEDVVCPIYIGLMQKILTDPYSGAPVDSPALFGSDGYVYGTTSYEFAFYSRPEEIRKRSPMNPDDPSRFFTVIHPVAEYMLSWLERRNARLISIELIRMHAKVVPQHVDTSRGTAAKIDFLLAKQEETGLGFYLADLEMGLQRIAVTEEKAFEALDSQAAQTAHHLQSAQAQLEVIQAAETQAKNRLKAGIEEHMQRQVAAQSAPATVMNAQTVVRLDALGVEAQRALHQLQQKRESLERKISQLEQENQQLKVSYEHLGEEARALNQNAIQFREGILETKIAIKKAKRDNVLAAVGWAVGSWFGTWAIQAWMASTGIGASVTFSRQENFLALTRSL